MLLQLPHLTNFKSFFRIWKKKLSSENFLAVKKSSQTVQMLPRLIFRWFDLNLSQGSNTLRKTIGRGQIQRRYICTCYLIMFIYDIIFRNYSNPNFFTEVKRQFCYLFTNSDGRIESVLRIGFHFFMFHSYLTQMSTFLHSK